ncbi:MAG: hypothetical protein MZU95_00520 [Desulfomicrobium escambiense]|nr:hypothetical protein [Desulfomicrobium escambiense]
MGPDAPPAERNILGLVEQGRHRRRSRGHQPARDRRRSIQQMIGGRATHPGLEPSRRRDEARSPARSRTASRSSLPVSWAFGSSVSSSSTTSCCKNKGVRRSHPRVTATTLMTNYMGLVDEQEPRRRSTTGRCGSSIPKGTRSTGTASRSISIYIAEHVEPYTYLKFPYLKKLRVARVHRRQGNVALPGGSARAVQRARAAWRRRWRRRPTRRCSRTLGGKPVHEAHGHALGAHRLSSSTRAETPRASCIDDEEILDPNVRVIPPTTPSRRGRDRRGAARHSDASLRDRRARNRHEGEPHRRDDEQQRPDLHGGQESRRRSSSARGARSRKGFSTWSRWPSASTIRASAARRTAFPATCR